MVVGTYLDLRELYTSKTLGCVVASVFLLLLAHNSCPQLLGLVVVVLLTLMPIVAQPAHDVVVDLVRSLSHVRSKLVSETVGGVLLVSRMVGINAHGPVEVE